MDAAFGQPNASLQPSRVEGRHLTMTKYILAGGTLVLAVAIPRFAPAASTIQPVSTAVRAPGAGGERSPLVVASSRDLTSMLVAPRDDGSDSGDDGDDGGDDGGD